MLLAVTLLALAASAATTPHPAPPVLHLAHPLPALHEFAPDSARGVVAEYHAPVGVPEAARIAAAEGAGQGASPLIVGGLASYRGEHPFMAGLVISLTSGETSVCGGALVTGARVLTAAACYWDGRNQAAAMLTVLGSVTLFSGGTRVYGSSIALHAAFTPAALHYNLAVLTIPYQASTAYVKPIALSSTGDYVGYSAEVIGYGRTSDSAAITTAASQRDVFVSVISNSVCQQYYGSAVTAGEMCTSGAGGRNPCGGDQGGPLILYSSSGNDLLLGVFTFGSAAGCAAGEPAGYQRVSYHHTWILSQL